VNKNEVPLISKFSPVMIPVKQYHPAINVIPRPVDLGNLRTIRPVNVRPSAVASELIIPIKRDRDVMLREPLACPIIGRIVKEVKTEILETLSIMPGEYDKAERTIKKYLSNFKQEVVGILSYIDDTTIDFLSYIPYDVPIRILTSATGSKKAKIKQKLKAEQKDRQITIVELTFITDNKEKPLLHERWLADRDIFLEIGTDLKKASLAARQHNITAYYTKSQKPRLDTFLFYWQRTANELSRILNCKVKKEVIH